MSRVIEEFKRKIKGKKVAVMGVGVSNRPLVIWLYKLGAEITVFDQQASDSSSMVALADFYQSAGIEVNWSLGPDYLQALSSFDLIFRTPSLHLDNPYLQKAKEEGAVLSSEMELFFALCPAKIIAVTGSDGKTTTSTIIAELLKQEGYQVWLGGNIGQPLLCEVESMGEEDIVVLELSSFQLMGMSQSPNIAVITNLLPNHLDIHHDYADYAKAKTNIFLHQRALDSLIVSGLSPDLLPYLAKSKAEITWLDQRGFGKKALYFQDDEYLYYQEREGAKPSKLLSKQAIVLAGHYNYSNYLAAFAATKDLVSDDSRYQVSQSFTGVEHRLELFLRAGEVDFYNSSIDSSPQRTMQTLSYFIEQQKPLVLVAGGKDKNCDYTGLATTMLKASQRIILCGENASIIEAELKKAARDLPYVLSIVSTYAEIPGKLAQLIKPGDSVLLSPAGTSFDLFANFAQRGKSFKQIIKANFASK